MPIKSVRIANDEDWRRKMLLTLQTCYGSAPFYLYYFDDLSALINKKWDFLYDLNLALLIWLRQCLNGTFTINESVEYHSGKQEGIDDIRNEMQPSQSFFFSNSSINYTQVFEEKHGFIPNLSIIDLLMCCGPEAEIKLKEGSKHEH